MLDQMAQHFPGNGLAMQLAIVMAAMSPFVAFFWCCCGESCDLFADDFAAEELGPSWSIEDGTWAIASGELAATAAPGELLLSTAHPSGDLAPHRASVKIKLTASSGDNEAGIMVAYDADGDHLWATVKRTSAGCSTLELGKRVAGVDTTLASQSILAMDLDEVCTLAVCWTPAESPSEGLLFARITQTSTVPATSIGASFDVAQLGDQVGLRLMSGEALFDDFVFSKYIAECANCNVGCTIFGDEFIRADSTNLGCEWTEVSGDWSIASSSVVPVVGVLRCNRWHPDRTTHHRVQIVASSSGNNGRPRAIVNYLDANNYLFGEVQIGSTSGTLRLYRRAAGTNTLVATATVSANWTSSLTMVVCFNGTSLVLTATTSSGHTRSIGAVVTGFTDGIYAGIGCDNVSGTLRINSFLFERHRDAQNPTCGECSPDCSSCCDPTDQPPMRLKITVGPGLTNRNCSYCELVEGEYLLDYFPSGNPCRWRYRSGPVCTITTGPCVAYPSLTTPVFDIMVTIVNDGFGTCYWVAQFQLGLLSSPDFVCLNAKASYQLEIDGDCQAFPVTLPRVNNEVIHMCFGAWPLEVSIESAA